MRIKLFFEYNDQNEVIRDEYQCKRFNFIKKKIYQLFEKKKYNVMNFLSFIENMKFKIRNNIID